VNVQVKICCCYHLLLHVNHSSFFLFVSQSFFSLSLLSFYCLCPWLCIFLVYSTSKGSVVHLIHIFASIIYSFYSLNFLISLLHIAMVFCANYYILIHVLMHILTRGDLAQSVAHLSQSSGCMSVVSLSPIFLEQETLPSLLIVLVGSRNGFKCELHKQCLFRNQTPIN